MELLDRARVVVEKENDIWATCAKIFEVVDIVEQDVQKKTSGVAWNCWNIWNMELLNRLKLLVCILLVCYTLRISSETDPLQGSKIPKQTILFRDLNTKQTNQKNDASMGSNIQAKMLPRDLISKQMILPWVPKQTILSRDVNTQQTTYTSDPHNLKSS